MKKVLITGKNSYIGTQIKQHLSETPDQFEVTELDVKEESWKKLDLSNYDSIFHVAGIAHVSSDPKLEELYYQVNTELTAEIAKKAKESGVKQFIFMSSIIVYGSNPGELISKSTLPNPDNFYGESKLKAEEQLHLLETEQFKIAILRPPMIYGPNSKGNYPRLAKLAQKTPIFPSLKNKRSMLYVGNLAEFIRFLIEDQASGTFYPQNKDFVSSTNLVKAIAEYHHHRIWFTGLFNFILRPMTKKQGSINKVFGDLCYEQELSYYTRNYQLYNFEESIKKTESWGEKDE